MSLADLSTEDQILVLRSTAHVLAVSETPPVLRFRDGVTELDAARLILSVERGAVIVQAVSGRSWHAVPRRAGRAPLTRIVEQCLHFGLVYRDSVITGPALRRIQLGAPPIHLRTDHGLACRADMVVLGRRWRSLADPRLVDCLACKRADEAY